MKEYTRKYPEFSLCGLNCVLCPRFHTDGTSKCPGCGGIDFFNKHPACSVITCSKKHGDMEFCFECNEYPCKKYQVESNQDSFITYKNVLANMAFAEKNLEQYVKEIRERQQYLEELIINYDDGRQKNFYCVAVNLLSTDDMRTCMAKIREITGSGIEIKEKAKEARRIIEEIAEKKKIKIELRKK